MPRIRTIKPEFFTSEDIVSLSPLARLFFQACWCEADREGRMNWKPRTMKLRYFPADKCDIEAIAGEVVERGLLRIYTVNGETYAYIPSFGKHQHVNPREAHSSIPEPPENDAHTTRDDACPTRDDASNLELTHREEGKGKERKGREGASARATQLSPEWEPEPEAEFPAALVARELPRFRDHWRGNGEAKKDWQATWRNWLRRSLEFAPLPNAPGKPRHAVLQPG